MKLALLSYSYALYVDNYNISAIKNNVHFIDSNVLYTMGKVKELWIKRLGALEPENAIENQRWVICNFLDPQGIKLPIEQEEKIKSLFEDSKNKDRLKNQKLNQEIFENFFWNIFEDLINEAKNTKERPTKSLLNYIDLVNADFYEISLLKEKGFFANAFMFAFNGNYGKAYKLWDNFVWNGEYKLDFLEWLIFFDWAWRCASSEETLSRIFQNLQLAIDKFLAKHNQNDTQDEYLKIKIKLARSLKNIFSLNFISCGDVIDKFFPNCDYKTKEELKKLFPLYNKGITTLYPGYEEIEFSSEIIKYLDDLSKLSTQKSITSLDKDEFWTQLGQVLEQKYIKYLVLDHKTKKEEEKPYNMEEFEIKKILQKDLAKIQKDLAKKSFEYEINIIWQYMVLYAKEFEQFAQKNTNYSEIYNEAKEICAKSIVSDEPKIFENFVNNEINLSNPFIFAASVDRFCKLLEERKINKTRCTIFMLFLYQQFLVYIQDESNKEEIIERFGEEVAKEMLYEFLFQLVIPANLETILTIMQIIAQKAKEEFDHNKENKLKNEKLKQKTIKNFLAQFKEYFYDIEF